MSITKITERNLDEEFLQTLYTKDNPPTASDVGAVAESDLATAIQSLIDSGVISMSAVKSVQRGTVSLGSGAASVEATISAVDTNKAFVNFSYTIETNSSNSGSYAGSWPLKCELSTQKVKFSVYDAKYTHNIAYEVIEYA